MHKLNHFYWNPLPHIGYPEFSSGYSKGLKVRRFSHYFTQPKEYFRNPKLDWGLFDIDTTNKDFIGHILFNKYQFEILLTHVFVADDLDENGRPGPVNHTVIMERELLENGTLSISKVNEEMNRYEKKYRPPSRLETELKILEVKLNEVPGFEYKNKIQNYLTKEAVEQFIYNRIHSEKPSLIRCVELEADERFRIGQYLVELSNFDHKVRNPLSFCTEYPKKPQYNILWNLYITRRAIKVMNNPDEYHIINDNDTSFKMDRTKSNNPIFKKIDEVYDGGWT